MDQEKYKVKMNALIVILPFMVACANVSTTKFIYRDANSSVTIEMPKELQAKKLVVTIDSKNGTATITADAIQTLNTSTIKAQGERESGVAGAVTEGASKGAVEGLIKGLGVP